MPNSAKPENCKEKAPRAIRLGDTVFLRSLSGKYLDVDGDDIHARKRSGLQHQRFVVCPYLNSQAPDMAEEPFPKRKLANTVTFKGVAVRDGDAICLMACNGYFLGITDGITGEDTEEPNGRCVVKVDFPASAPPCAMVVRTAKPKEQVLDGRGIYLQSLASAQLLCVDENDVVKMEHKQPPGELRHIGFQEHHQLLIQALPKPRRWKVDSISLEGSFLRWPEVGVRVRQATDGSRKFGMTVEHDTKSGEDVVGWVKVKWDHGAEENCRVGAEGCYDLLVISLPSFTATGAGGVGKDCNGHYIRVGTHNGMPKYRLDHGDAIMFFEDDGWKMNSEDDTRQWCYQHLEASARYPPLGRWSIAFGGPDASPSPNVTDNAAKATATEAIPPSRPSTSPKVTRRRPASPQKSAEKTQKQEFLAGPAPEAIRLGDLVYLRGNGRFLQVEGSTVSAPNRQADQECQRFLVCPYMNNHKDADWALHAPEAQKLASTKTFRGRKVKDGDAICLMAFSGCFLGISGMQVDGGGTVALGVLSGRRWVKADFSEASPMCAMVVKTVGQQREVREGDAFYLQSMASSQLLVADEKSHLGAVVMQPSRPAGDLMSGPQKHQELHFRKVPKDMTQAVAARKRGALKECEEGVRVRYLCRDACTQGQGHGITFASDSPGFINVRWDSGEESKCRVGADGKYDLYVLARPAMEVAFAGGSGELANGRFQKVGVYNGRPKYQQEFGEPIIYFQDGWKINVENDTARWLYQHPDVDSPVAPTGQWQMAELAKYAEPAPLVSFQPLQAPMVSGSQLAPPACPKALDLLLLSSLDQIKGPRAARAVRLALPRFAAAKPSGRREPPKLRRVQVDDAFDILAQYAETDDSKIGADSHQLVVLDGFPFLVHYRSCRDLDDRLSGRHRDVSDDEVEPNREIVAYRSEMKPLLLLGARALFRVRASEPFEVCFRFPSNITKMLQEETWMGRKRYEQSAGYLVQVDVGLLRQQKLRPEETLPKKQISNDFRCGFPRRVQLTSKEQLVKTQLHPKHFNIFGVAEVAVCLVVMDHSKMAHQHWTLVSYSMVSVLAEVEEKETAPK